MGLGHVLEHAVLGRELVAGLTAFREPTEGLLCSGGRLTLITMADWMTPRMGGRPCCSVSAISRDTCSSDATSHLGATTVTPLPSISSIKSKASPVGPERERQRMYLAPWSAIHEMMERPRPPKPPTMTYVASARSCAGVGAGGDAYTRANHVSTGLGR